MTQTAEQADHRHLENGIELSVLSMPDRPVTAIEIRFFAGFSFENPSHLGVTHVLNEVITKGTSALTGRALNDAFDSIGAAHASYAGREMMGFSAMCLPEFIEKLVGLHGEMICDPSFPDNACDVALELTQQALAALEDDPHESAHKLLNAQAYGEPLGRHVLGHAQTLSGLVRDDIIGHWRRFFGRDRMQVAVAGPVDPGRTADLLTKSFERLPAQTGDPAPTRPDFHAEFEAVRSHHMKDAEQEQVAICFPGAAAADDDFPAEKVIIGILSGGMSGRLFAELREKQGLVYWVGAHGDHTRNSGMLHVGASTTPDRVDKTYHALLREIDRLAEDVTEHEVSRAITGIVTRTQTRGDITRSRATELANDMFYYDRPIPTSEKLDRIKAVSITDVKRYLDRHPRDQLSVVTLGPRELTD